MTACDRLLLYVMTGVEGPVLSCKRLLARCDFKGDDVALSARSAISFLVNDTLYVAIVIGRHQM